MKVYLEVYGCTANKSDASLIKGILKDNNYKLVDKINNADTLILLSCTVIDTTEQRMLSRLKKLKNTGKKIIVGGCMASIQSDKVKSIIPNAGLLPPQYSHQILDVLNSKKTNFKLKNKTQFSKHYEDIFAPISIAEGCNFSCSYCITSKARGKLKSYPMNEITQDICSAIRQDCREIQLTSQDTSSYGLDIGKDLGELLLKISKIEGQFRVRVGMMNPYTCLKNIKSIITGFKPLNIYKFLHLPVQSGDDKILEKMNRKYLVKDFLKIIKKFRESYPDITISTDAIVGFPTETDDQFQHTVDLLEEVKPDIINITRYSARPYTKAKNMNGRVNTSIVKERSKYLTELCNKISKQNNLKHIGKKYYVLVTEKGKNNTYVGRSENYKPVVLNEKVKIGEIKKVNITKAANTFLVGSII
ncbi:MAG: tRNA (N(6)-L-threonylcarbamoyladenosine(37)-C(2))-methylthiotransferase [Thermoplasmatales archaeon]|nr:MAG: tRNA (N(6)-L-threonylcarbamoyladenosine(37)-C(2))-methylthiotransferase [Thermoplasmatales archaeon]